MPDRRGLPYAQVFVESPRPITTTASPSSGFSENLRLAEIPSLSGLRAFASVTVVLCHAVSPIFPARHAVTLFFALSGFLITTLLCREMAATGAIDIRAFYFRRARRLLPAYYVWLVAVMLFMTGRITPEIGAAALYLSDYFNAWVKEGPISHTWSLSVEEHFYLLWPIVLLTWSRAKYFVPTIAALIVLVQVARSAFAAAYPLYFFYSFEAKIDALLLGCVLGLWASNGGVLPTFLANRLFLLLPVGGFVWLAALPGNRMLTVGDTAAAYFSVLLIANVVASPPVILNFSVHGWTNQAAVVLLSIGAASVSYSYVERPFQAWWRPSQGAKTGQGFAASRASQFS
ncbi:MAG: acyltransferase [Bryobacteraceae bacterium]